MLYYSQSLYVKAEWDQRSRLYMYVYKYVNARMMEVYMSRLWCQRCLVTDCFYNQEGNFAPDTRADYQLSANCSSWGRSDASRSSGTLITAHCPCLCSKRTVVFLALSSSSWDWLTEQWLSNAALVPSFLCGSLECAIAKAGSVRLSVGHTRDQRLNGLRYGNVLCTIR